MLAFKYIEPLITTMLGFQGFYRLKYHSFDWKIHVGTIYILHYHIISFNWKQSKKMNRALQSGRKPFCFSLHIDMKRNSSNFGSTWTLHLQTYRQSLIYEIWLKRKGTVYHFIKNLSSEIYFTSLIGTRNKQVF